MSPHRVDTGRLSTFPAPGTVSHRRTHMRVQACAQPLVVHELQKQFAQVHTICDGRYTS